MKIDELKNKKILIVGYGMEGKASHEYLKAVLPEATIATTDQSTGKDYLEKQAEFDIAVKSPGVKPDALSIPYTTSANIFFANTKGTIIGVTGTKGKSTTASLIYSILKEAGKNVVLVGNIGNPALPELLKKDSTERIYVYELSSYVLADLNYSPHISVVINIFPDHLTYHGGFEPYAAAKRNIIARAKPDDYFVYNEKFPQLIEWAQSATGRSIPFAGNIDEGHLKTKLIGEHNLDNIRAAITVARLYEIADDISYNAVNAFIPLPHRLENVGTFKSITFYDDAISTTPESTIAALNALKDVKTIFLGGEDRGYSFEELSKELKKSCVESAVLFPESGKKIRDLLEKEDSAIKFFETSSMEEAVKFAYENTPEGSICLLSTASPSYSLWKDFNDKGDEFQRFVKEQGSK